ncbi:MAG: GNAT superfamily N-acetyltransferase [Verrucomicrobiales bacterium]|jgi:GNAT superfamily N-acetyltransferase
MSDQTVSEEGLETWVEPATLEDIEVLTTLLMTLFDEEEDFIPDRDKQQDGIQLILEQPSRGRIFVVRNEHTIIGMVNLLFIISTAEGGLVILMEDVVVHPDHRGQHYGSMLVEHVIQFAKDKNFTRITLLTDKISQPSQRFFQRYGFVHSHMIPMRLSVETSPGSAGEEEGE